MELTKVAREQQIAVFGESGSGKTVLLSSFYGAAQEPRFKEASLFSIVADDAEQHIRLHQNYLGMKNSAEKPMSDHFSSTSFSFSIKQRTPTAGKAKKAKQAHDLRLIWHDYPGEWFEQDPNGPEEAKRRIDTFRTLLTSDVALLLVDGQKLLDNSGSEERYLKALLTNFQIGLLKLHDQLLTDGKPLVTFPRIWMIALSKSDLLPDLNVIDFRDLVVEKAGGEIIELRKVLAGLIEAPDALSVGEDFVLLSSAKFEPGNIELTKRVGLDLILPLAAMLPFSRYVKWALAMNKGGKVAEHLLDAAGGLAALFGGKVKLSGLIGLLPGIPGRLAGPIGAFLGLFGPDLAGAGAKLAGDKLKAMNVEAKAKHDFLIATLTGFQLDLDKAEEDRVLLRSPK